MRRHSAIAGLGALFLASLGASAAGPQAFSGKAALYSEYEYRGIAQTSEDPALQLTLDYAHASGFYLGTFLSNVKWLEDTGERLGIPSDANVEWDLYGGYKWRFSPGWTLDAGYLRYLYPRSRGFEPHLGSPDTSELYAGLSWGPATVRYSYALTQLFGVPDSEGSDYLELAVNQPLAEKLTLNASVGHQRYRGTQLIVPTPGGDFDNGNFDYTVWKLGVTYDFGSGLSAGAYYKGTDADPVYFTFQGRDWSRNRLVGFVGYSF